MGELLVLELGLRGADVLVGHAEHLEHARRHRAGDRLPVVEVGDALALGAVEQAPGSGPADRVGPEVIGSPATGIVLLPIELRCT